MTEKKRELVTNKRVAEHLDLTQEYVSKLKSEGILPGGRGRQNMDLRQSRLAYINFLRTKARMSPKGADTTISVEKTRLTKAQADKAVMEVEVLQRGMLKAEEVKDTWVAFVSNVRAKLLNLPSKVAHQVIGIETYYEAEEIINEEIREVLNELSRSELPDELRMAMDGNSEDVHTSEEDDSKRMGGQA